MSDRPRNPVRILVLNAGSTSTKLGVYEDERCLFSETLRHDETAIRASNSFLDQYPMRKRDIMRSLEEHETDLSAFDIAVSRGGTVRPLEGGTYLINDAFVRDAETERYGSHVCNVGCKLAHDLAMKAGIPAVTVDPPCIDEMIPEARYTGMPEFRRKSLFQALSQRATARKLAAALGKKYEEMNAVVAHMGGGMSIAAHRRGRIVDVNNGLDGDGPMAPERAGTLPAGDLVRLCFSGTLPQAEIIRKINGRGGLYAYLGTADVGAIEARADTGDAKAEELLSAMCYQIGKDIGAAAAVLRGKVDALGFTGGLVNSKFVMDRLREQTSWLAPVHVFQEQNEMEALALGALRHIRGTEPAREY